MKQSLLSSWLCVSSTLTMTVGSPSAHRRGTMLRLLSVLVLVLTFGVGNVWGAETLVYTLDGTSTGGSNGYATESDITQSSQAWKVTGNTTMSPWRIGGKKISNENRPIYTTFTFTDNISKVTVETGSSTLDNVHSITLIVSSSQNGAGTVTSSIAKTSSLTSTTLTFERPAGNDWSGKYFSIVFNVSKSADSNAYVEFKNAKFYKEVSCTPLAAPGSPSSTPHAESVDLSWNSVSGATGYLVTFNGTEYNIASGTTTKTISGLSMETEYHWTVAAKGDGTTNCAVGTATADQTVTTLDDCTGTKVTYSVTSTSAVSVSGTAPTGATATYSSTYSSKCQLTNGHSMTLTLSGYEGYIIKSIKLSMKSNTGGGSGNFSAVAGTTTISSISTAAFNSASWNGAYTTSYVTIVPTMSNDGYTIKKDENVVITIAATVNSLYCESFSICYEEGCHDLGQINGSVSLTHNSATLEWDAIEGVTAWSVSGNIKNGAAIAAGDIGAIKPINVGAQKQCVISNLSSSTAYEFQIHATTISSGYCTTVDEWDLEGSTEANYTITEATNDALYGSVTRSGNVITGAPEPYCRYASPAFTVVSGTATVEQGTGENVNKFTVTPSANCSIRINFEPIPVTGVTMSSNAETLEVGGNVDLTATVEPNTVNPAVTWQSSNTNIATVSNGTVTAVAAGSATITATSVGDNTKSATCAITVVPAVDYKKVTAALDDWSGEYLLVYENSETDAWVYTGVDAANNYATATISNNKITKPAGGAKLTIASMEGGYSIQLECSGTNNGKYLSGTSGSNITNFGDAESANTLGYSTDHATITSNTSNLTFNKANDNLRFRYFKSSSTMAAVQLYRKVVTSAVTITAPATGTGSLTLVDGQTEVTSGDNIEAGTELTVTATPNSGNHYIGGTVTVTKTVGGDDVTAAVYSNGKITMPEYAITVSATFTPTYAITKVADGGSIALSYTQGDAEEGYATAGTSVTATATADGSHVFTSISLSNNVENPSISANVATFTMPASAVTVTAEFAVKQDPSIVVTDGTNPITALNFGSVAKTSDPVAQTFKLSGLNLAQGTLTIASSDNTKFTVSPTSINVEGTLEETTVTVTPVTSVAGTFNDEFIMISGGGLAQADEVMIGLSLTVQETYTAKWYVNGAEQLGSTVTGIAGTALTFPDAPTPAGDCAGTEFMGWLTAPLDEASADEPDGLIKTYTGHTMPAADVNYYAVFADETPGVEGTSTWVFVSSDIAVKDATQQATSYARYAGDQEKDGITFNIADVQPGTSTNVGKLQLKASTGTIYNKTAMPGDIVSIAIADIDLAVYQGTEAISSTPGSDAISKSGGVYPFSAGKRYFHIKKNTSNAGYSSSITVTYKSVSDPTYSNWVTTCPHCDKVTLQKAIVGEGAEAAGNAIAFSPAVTSVKTCEAAEVTVNPTIATGWELTSVVPTGVPGVTYDAGVISIPAEATGELTVTATFSPIMVTEVELDETSLDVDMGASPVELHATCTPAEALDKTVTWATSDGNVATVSNGTVTFVGAGTATITATCNGHNAACSVTVNPAPDVVLDFTTNDTWNFPLQAQKGTTEQSFTKGGYTVKVAGGNSYYFDTNNLLIGKLDAYIELPAFNKPIDKIVCTGVSGGSSGVTRVVLRGEEIVSEEAQTGCTTDKTFNLEPQEQADSYVYTIKVTNGNNARFAKIKIYLGEVASVLRPTISGAVNFVESSEVTLNCATEGATIYYTTNGESPKTSEGKILYSEPFSVTENTVVKAAAYKEGDWSAISTKTFTKGTLYTVAQALAAIEALEDNEETDEVFVEGTISTLDSYASYNNSIQYRISADGSTTNQLYVHNGKGLDGADFSKLSDLELEDIVIVYGKLKKYVENNITKFEVNSPNYIYSLNRRASAGLAWSAATAAVGITGDKNYATLTNPNGVAVTYSSSDHTVATISNEEGHEGEISLVAAGTTTISASFVANETYKSATVSYELEVRDILVYASISYELDGANEDIEDVDVATNLPNPLPTVTKDGHHFGGWFTDAAFETPAIAGAPLLENTTLYVKWIEIPTFNNSGYEWQLVTSADQLVAGKYYVLTSSAQSVVASNISSNIMGTESAAFEDDVIAYNGFGDSQIADASGAIVFQLGGEAGAWTLDEAVNQRGLLGYNGDKKVQWGGDNTTWTIAIADNNATIVPVAATTYHILYNVSSPRFTVYNSNPSALMLLPQLYVWAPKIYKVIYDANGGSNAPAATKAVDGVATVTSATPTAPEGKEFYCWNGNTEGTGAIYWATDKVAVSDADLTIYAVWRDLPTKEAISAIGGKFIINQYGDTAVFSRGNLQHQLSTNTWRCAPNQYDWAGEAANEQMGNPKYEGWVDLFSWSIGAENNYGATSAYNTALYENKTFVDWGTLFPESEGWSTLSIDEWYYMLYTRANANNLWGMAMIGDTLGMILLPEGWTAPSGVTFVAGTMPTTDMWYDEDCLDPTQTNKDHWRLNPDNLPANKFTQDEWAQLEAAGAVFMPYAGRRSGGYGNHTNKDNETIEGEYKYVYWENYYGAYWTSKVAKAEEGKAYWLPMICGGCDANHENWGRGSHGWWENGRYGHSVRLAYIIPRKYTVTYDANGATAGEVPTDANKYLAGVPITVAGQGTLVKEGHVFAGWKLGTTTYNAEETVETPRSANNVVFVAQWLKMVETDIVLVTNTAQLNNGDKVYIVAAASNNAMGAQNSSIRERVSIYKNEAGDRLLTPEGVNVPATELTLGVSGDNYTFQDGSAYLCAVSSSDNHIGTQTDLTDNGKWAITISTDQNNNIYASAVAQGTYSKKSLQFNTGNPRFSCYSENNSMAKVAIFKKLHPVTIPENRTVSSTTITAYSDVIMEEGSTLEMEDEKPLGNLTVTYNTKIDNTVHPIFADSLNIQSKAGISGQVLDKSKLNASEIYIDIKFYTSANDATLEGDEANQWYMISAPFNVNLSNGFINPVTGATMHMGNDDNVNTFDLFEFDGSKRATTGVTGWKRVQGQMPAGKACLIGFNPGQPTTIRLQAADPTGVKESGDPTSITLGSYAGDDDNANWNGVANPRMCYTSVDQDVQIWNNEEGENGRKYITYGYDEFSFVVGTPFFVQASGSINLTGSLNGSFRAPKHENKRYSFRVQITREGATEFADQMYVRASEEASNAYEQGHDMITWNGTSGKTALLWSENYGGKRLSIEEAPLVNEQASYSLGIFAPQAGEYIISTPTESERATLYLTLNGQIIWNLSQGAYTAELQQGQNSGYGLKIVAAPQTPTDIEQPTSDSSLKGRASKLILDQRVYILRGGQMYDVTGKMVK